MMAGIAMEIGDDLPAGPGWRQIPGSDRKTAGRGQGHFPHARGRLRRNQVRPLQTRLKDNLALHHKQQNEGGQITDGQPHDDSDTHSGNLRTRQHQLNYLRRITL